MRAAIGLITITILGCAGVAKAQTTSLPLDNRPTASGAAAEPPVSAGGRQADRGQAIFSRQAVFAIPFTVAQPNRNGLEVLLFVSADRGASWDMYARESAVKGQFGFRAGRDGEYWFASRTVPAGTNLSNRAALAPELRVVVDTREPRLDVEASINHNGEIEVSWDATDDQLTADSLRVEYQSALGQPWRTARMDDPGDGLRGKRLQGRTAWAPEGGGRFVSIRVQVSDMAGNVNQAVRRLLVPTTVAHNTSASPRTHSAADVPQDPLSSHGLMPLHVAQLPSDSSGRARTREQTPSVQDEYDRLFGSPGGQSSSGTHDPGSGSQGPGTYGSDTYGTTSYGSNSGESSSDRSTGRDSDSYASDSHEPDTYEPDTYESNPFGSSFDESSTYGSGNRAMAKDDSDSDEPDDQGWDSYVSDDETDSDPAGVSWPSDRDRGTHYDQPRTGFASSGDVYQGSKNSYGTYASSSSDTDEVESDSDGTESENLNETAGAEASSHGLPPGERPRMTNSTRFNLAYSVDAAGPMGLEKVELWVTRNGGREWNLWGIDEDKESPLLVELEDEGIYGFRVVIVSKNGMASQTPRSGDLADIWVGIDATDPEAEITTAAYGSGGHAGHLNIQWTASDDHLGQRPITLSFSETRNGPWTAIASGLPNTGEYHWRVDSSVPDKFYLRLEVRDEAGNLHVDQLKRPLQSAGLTPKGRVRSFEPLSE